MQPDPKWRSAPRREGVRLVTAQPSRRVAIDRWVGARTHSVTALPYRHLIGLLMPPRRRFARHHGIHAG